MSNNKTEDKQNKKEAISRKAFMPAKRVGRGRAAKKAAIQMQTTSQKSRILSYLLVLFAGVVQALGLYIFILPNRFSPGGITGIAAVFEYINPKLNTGYFIIALNIPLLIGAFIFFKKEYVIKTAMAIALTSGLLILFPMIDGFPQYATDQPILAAIAGGVFGGVSIGMLLRWGGSNGGSEIIAGFLHRRFPQFNLSWFLFVFDSGVVLGTAFVIDGSSMVMVLNIILLSIIKMFMSSRVASSMIEGFNSAIKFEIVTPHPQEISQEIMDTMGRGVTQINVRGGYTGTDKSILICIVRKRQIGSFQRLLKKYPDTFAYIMHTKEVYGRGFSIPNLPPEPTQDKGLTKE